MIRYLLLLLFLSIPYAQAMTKNGFDTELYGFIKASAMYSTEALGSFNNINLSAPTHAVAHTKSSDSRGRLSFQTQQTRAGVNMKKGDNISAKIEFDFIDFNKSSPTTQMNPRVRIASVTYAWENQKVIIGQDWDLFSPVGATTFDYVGLYFLAGNTGFMRQQAQYLNTQGNWEIAGAIGMAGNNPGTIDSDLELSKAPSYSARASYSLENGRMGVSTIYAKLKYETNQSSHDSYAYNVFFEKVLADTIIKSEAYYGQNLANLGSLSIGRGTATSNVNEFGGTLSVSRKLDPQNIPFAGIGFAKVDNKNELTPFATTTTGTNVITAPGIKSNFLMRLGWEYKVTEDFSWISEVSRYETTSKLTALNYQNNISGSLETGIQLRF